MPILDWMRTNISYQLPDGSKALYFERSAVIAFDLFLLMRPGSAKDYTEEEITKAKNRLEKMTKEEKEILFSNVLLGLPVSEAQFSKDQILSALKAYDTIDAIKLKQHLFYFLQQIIPVAQVNGLRMAIHPDDPPYPVLGLPRIISTEKDIEALLNAVPSPANGLCFCTGSFGARADNDLVQMIHRFWDSIHFLHLRNTKRDDQGNFYEANHLDGDADMVAIIREIVLLMKRRKAPIPMRPDHGHQMLDDLKKTTNPGYSAIGRSKGLAELRGLELGISRFI